MEVIRIRYLEYMVKFVVANRTQNILNGKGGLKFRNRILSFSGNKLGIKKSTNSKINLCNEILGSVGSVLVVVLATKAPYMVYDK